jgi:hypothetical protein
MKNNVILPCVMLFLAHTLFAQTPPTLSAGLGMLTGTKGTIDVELLSEIISEKQAELKKEGVRRLILNETDTASFVDKNFAYLTLSCLLDYKNKSVIEKEIIEAATNYALVYSLELSLKDLINESDLNKGNPSINEKITGPKIKNSETTSPDNSKEKKEYQGGADNRKILRDLIWHVMSKNDDLKSAGYFKVHPDLQTHYNALNQYTSLKEDEKAKWAEIVKIVQDIVNLLAKHGRLFAEFTDNSLTIPQLTANSQASVKSLPNNTTNTSFNLISLDSCIISLQTINSSAHCDCFQNNSIFSERLVEITKQTQLAIKGLQEFKMRIPENANLESAQYDHNDYYFLKKIVLPLMSTLVIDYGYPAENLITIQKVQQIIHSSLINQAFEDVKRKSTFINTLSLDKINTNHLLELIGAIDDLDQAKTYEKVFNFIQSLGDKDETIGNYTFLKTLIFYLENFSTIDTEKNQIILDVEEIILHLYEQYEKQDRQGLQIYFGIGLNQAVSLTSSPLTTPEGNDIDNFSFAAEKIGLKFKLADFGRNHSMENQKKIGLPNYKYKSETPLINDLYILGFGSGLLYNLADVTTSKTATSTSFLGTGLGVHFFNDFDLNLYLMRPTSDWDNALYAGFSFDIMITEYLRKLGEKRKSLKESDEDKESD